MSQEVANYKQPKCSIKVQNMLNKVGIRPGFTEHWRVLQWILKTYDCHIMIDFDVDFMWVIAKINTGPPDYETYWHETEESDNYGWKTPEEATDAAIEYFLTTLYPTFNAGQPSSSKG